MHDSNCSVVNTVYHQAQSLGCLPHTGWDIWPIIVAGIILLLMGVLLHKTFK